MNQISLNTYINTILNFWGKCKTSEIENVGYNTFIIFIFMNKII